MNELQQLSREAARKLPEGLTRFQKPEAGKANYYHGDGDWTTGVWLHESTEACAEIMVLVLWEQQVGLGPSWENAVRAFFFGSGKEILIAFADDPMQAFRTAVLRAVVAL